MERFPSGCTVLGQSAAAPRDPKPFSLKSCRELAFVGLGAGYTSDLFTGFFLSLSGWAFFWSKLIQVKVSFGRLVSSGCSFDSG